MDVRNSNKNKEDCTQANTLRILAVSDHVEPQLYNNSVATWLGPIDLLISCGDLPPYYLDFLMTTLNAPLMHVLGNHCYVSHDPLEGCSSDAYPGAYNLNRRVHTLAAKEGQEPLLLAGLEGSPWYNGGPHQYTDTQAALNLSALVPRLLLNKAQRGRYLDILVTHAPPRGIHDNGDRPHLGFTPLIPFLDRVKPAILLHGHTHRYDLTLPMQTCYKNTEVINAYGHVLLELSKKDDAPGWRLKPQAYIKSDPRPA